MTTLNYRHAFHAGNFADIVKHSLLLAVLDRLTHAGGPLTVLDTHAGAGVYDLRNEAALRSGEAQDGVAALMAASKAPPALQALATAVNRCNSESEVRLYPGSPWLALQALRPVDRYVGYELRPDDHAALKRRLRPAPGSAKVELIQADGYEGAAHRLRSTTDRTLLLVDPPFERADDYARVAVLVAGRPQPERQPALIWTPLKDLETLDAFKDRLEAASPQSLVVAETRLRPLGDPMRMNGCAVFLVDAPDVTIQAQAVCDWVAERLGEPGGRGRVERLA